jgi:hypothetical protein
VLHEQPRDDALARERVASSENNTKDDILNRSARQINASGGHPIVWVFAEEEAAQMVRKLFDTTGEGRQFITVVHIPWARKKP